MKWMNPKYVWGWLSYWRRRKTREAGERIRCLFYGHQPKEETLMPGYTYRSCRRCFKKLPTPSLAPEMELILVELRAIRAALESRPVPKDEAQASTRAPV